MYNLSYFKEKDPDKVLNLIRENPFALVCGSDKNFNPVATQVPVFIEEYNGKKILRGHLMKNTDHHNAFIENDKVLVVFSGPHCYVSATWYKNPKTASTWNYISAHVTGKIRFLGQKALEDILQKTSLYFEEDSEVSPTVFKNLPNEFKNRMMPAIVAFEIDIISIDNVFKLSQNRDFESFLNIITKLENGGVNQREIAKEMRQRIPEIFPEG